MKLGIFIVLCVAFGNSQAAANRPNPRYIGSRIVGGEATTIDKIPYQVSLSSNGISHFCGGSIISKDWILTAAHCAEATSVASLQVRVGSSLKSSGGELHKVESIIRHPNYDRRTIDYDFALIKLQDSLKFNKNISAVKLAKQDESVPGGAIVSISGWGDTKNSSQSTSQLRVVSVPIVDQDECISSYKGYTVTDRMICAGLEKGGKDSCQGDSGGPLVRKKTQQGIVSWGLGCALAGYPGVYARVAAARDWIKEVSGV